jgi:hypothetical protein
MECLDEIVFGNPTQEQLKLLNTDTELDSLFAELTAFTYPKNSSPATKEELNDIVNAISDLQKDEEGQKISRIYDSHLTDFYVRFLAQYKLPEAETRAQIEEILNYINPLIYKLKFYFNRPRPWQLAAYLKLKLFPFRSSGNMNPSFPSGHAIQSRVISEIFGNHFPEIYQQLIEISDDVCASRIRMGQHYASDIDVGLYVAECILKTKAAKIKYRL